MQSHPQNCAHFQLLNVKYHLDCFFLYHHVARESQLLCDRIMGIGTPDIPVG